MLPALLSLSLALALAPAAPQETGLVQVEGALLLDGAAGLRGVSGDAVALLLARGGLTLDGGRALGLPGLTLGATLLVTAGGSPGSIAGDLQGASNIEAPDAVAPSNSGPSRTWPTDGCRGWRVCMT